MEMINRILNLLRPRSDRDCIRLETIGRPRSSTPITLVSKMCPYCGEAQDPPPQRRKKCRDCGEVIFIRTSREEGKRYLLTAKQLGNFQRRQRDAQWKDLSRQLQRALQAGDLEALAQAYMGQASILFAEGRPHQHLSQEAVKAKLRQFDRLEIGSFEVLTSEDERVCMDCQVLQGIRFSVDDALTQPPLPNMTCTDGDNPHGGRCRCILRPIF